MTTTTATSAPVSILVVEDEPIVALDLERQLAALGYHVCGHASDAQQAIAAAARELPDLVLMDIRLAGGDNGVAVAEELYVCLGLPVVFVSAYSDAETIAMVRFAGAYGFVTKPFSASSLRSAITIALSKHAELRRSSGEAELHQSVVAAASVGLVATDAQGRVRLLNRMATQLLGCTTAEAVGQPLADFLELGDTAATGAASGDTTRELSVRRRPGALVRVLARRSTLAQSAEERVVWTLVER